MTKVRWLDDEEQQAWRAIVDGLLHYVRHVDQPVKEATGLTSEDYAMLVHLSESAERRAPMGELADCSGLPTGQVTYRVDRLVKLGYLVRCPSEADRRSMIAVLTDDGLEAFTAAAAVHVEAVRTAFLDHLSREELLALGESLRQVSKRSELAARCSSAARPPE